MSTIRKAAEKGFLSFDALLNPDSVAPPVQQPGMLGGQMVAQANTTNEFGFPDRMKVDTSLGSGKGGGAAATTTAKPVGSVRSSDQAARNEQLLQQGYSAEQIKAMELAGKMK